jgi:hypothetical protein
MTQAFNLSQLANNINTSGQLDATDGLTGIVPTANLGTGTANASTFLRGDQTYASVTATSIIKNYPLASGKSVTAGNIVSLNNSGEVGALPIENTLGTEYSNTGTSSAYDSISLDGSRAIRVTTARPNSSTGSVTFSGTALTGSANATNGGTSQTLSLSISAGTNLVNTPTFFYVLPLSATTFIGMGCISAGYNDGGTSNYMNLKLAVFTVDASGNVTKGAESSFTFNTTEFNFNTFVTMAQISSAICVLQYGVGSQVRNYTIGISGTTLTINTTDTEASQFLNATIFTTCVTSSNVICLPIGTSIRTATITSNNIGTVTNTALITDATSTPTWGKINNTDRFIAYYRDTSNIWKFATYTINQTTGAFTLVSTYSTATLQSISIYYFIFKSNTEGIFTSETGANSILLDASANILGTNNFLTVASYLITPRYNSGDIYYMNYYNNSSSNQKLRTYTVVSYITDAFKYNGVSTTTSSVSPVPIATSGTVGGYTGLTINATYYVATPITGAITTTVTTAGAIGKAISTTEILLGY